MAKASIGECKICWWAAYAAMKPLWADEERDLRAAGGGRAPVTWGLCV